MFLSKRVNYIKARSKQSSDVLRTKFPAQSAPMLSIMVSDRASSQTVFTAKFAASLHCFFTAQAHKYQCTYKNSLTPSQTNTIANSGTYTNAQPARRTLHP